MSEVGKPERATQNRVIALFRKDLGYRYLDYDIGGSHDAAKPIQEHPFVGAHATLGLGLNAECDADPQCPRLQRVGRQRIGHLFSGHGRQVLRGVHVLGHIRQHHPLLRHPQLLAVEGIAAFREQAFGSHDDDIGRRHRVDLVKSTSSDASGRFRLDRVPPGDYVAFAFDDVEEGQWQNPEYVAARESKGTRVRIASEAPQDVELVALMD